jgi:hypothetical protein
LIVASTRLRRYCSRRYGIHAGVSNAEIGTESAAHDARDDHLGVAVGQRVERKRRRGDREEAHRRDELEGERLLEGGVLVGLVCWMYLSAIPSCLSHESVTSAVRMIPHRPNSSRVRNAATARRWTSPSPARPTWNADVTIVPRAV